MSTEEGRLHTTVTIAKAELTALVRKINKRGSKPTEKEAERIRVLQAQLRAIPRGERW